MQLKLCLTSFTASDKSGYLGGFHAAIRLGYRGDGKAHQLSSEVAYPKDVIRQR
jgi:hypothetical protein